MTEPLLPGDPSALGGHRLLARLGAGGMGVVYLGRTQTGELAAVKVIQSEYADDPEFRARFRREVAAARRVTSPWAVPVTGAAPDADPPWLATAFVPGPSLGEAVARHGPLPVRGVRALARMLAAALREVHAAGLVHRDVKPGNVLLAVDGPRLIDFGIARAVDGTLLTSPDLVVGTPGFLSPEQAEARGRPVGPPSDVFSLGCLLAYAATGRPPFGTGAADALLYRTVHDEPDLDGLGEGTEGGGERAERAEREGLLALLRACLAKDPADRPTAARIVTELSEDGTPAGEEPADWLPEAVVRGIAARAAELLALPDIEPTAAGTPAPEHPAPADTPTPPPTRRRWLAVSGAAALVAAGGGGAVWAARRGDGGTGGAADDDRWALAVHADLSGPDQAAGKAQEQGARLAVEQYNARAKKPFELALRTADDGGSAQRAPSAAKKLVRDGRVLAVLGPTTESTARAAVGTYGDALLPLLTLSAGGLLMTSQQSPSLVHCRPGDIAVSVPLGAYLAGERGAGDSKAEGDSKGEGDGKRRPGLLQDRSAETYAWESAQITTLTLRQYGIPPYPRVVPADLPDIKPVVTDILRADVDSFVYSGYAKGAARVARELAAAGFDGPRLAPQAVLSPEFLKLAGEAAEGWLLTASFVDPAATPSASDFARAFRKRFGSAPGYHAAEAYDAVNLVVRELVKATRGERPPKRKELVKLLRKRRYRGITKDYAFSPEDGSFAGSSSGSGVFLYQVTDGRFRFLGDAPTGQ